MKKIIVLMVLFAFTAMSFGQIIAPKGIYVGRGITPVSGTNINKIDSITYNSTTKTFTFYKGADTADIYIRYSNRGTIYRQLADTVPFALFGTGTGAEADSTLFAKNANSFGMFRVQTDSVKVVSVDNLFISAADSLLFNIYIGNGMTNTPTDSLFTAPQGCGEHQISFTPSKTTTINHGNDVWVGLLGDQPTAFRPKKWYIQINAQIVKD